ncbi:unnamed protein product [Cyclocybe aegerita]|uniref:F-box domain-containing protein n=1 Tax=Cyclocybe aegerita TaxID=1973307 RepID=A0A8S0XPU5_CYCAE|nr:unnamed protein product [Cyclocybe aegerita]
MIGLNPNPATTTSTAEDERTKGDLRLPRSDFYRVETGNSFSGSFEEPTIEVDKDNERLIKPQSESLKAVDLIKDGVDEIQVSSFTPELPQEIWYCIFQRAIPPSWLLDPSLSLGPDAPWSVALRLKKNIVTVCKSWYSAGLPFLYEDVCIRRLSQFENLFLAFRNTRMQIGSLVKTVNILCYIPTAISTTFATYLGTIFSLCPRLHSFAYSSPTPIDEHAVNQILLKSITHLDLSRLPSQYSLIRLLAGVSATLRSLNLQIPSTPQELAVQTKVVLPSLSSLFLVQSPIPDEGAGLRFLTQHLDLPSLSRCTLDFSYQLFGHQGRAAEAVVEFLIQRGGNLIFLNIAYSYSNLSYHLLPLHLYCPLLEHFVMPVSVVAYNTNWIDAFKHPTLRHIDFMHPPIASASDTLGEIPLLRSNLPALQGARLVAELPRASYQWLQEFPPGAVKAADQRFVIDFYPNKLLHGIDYVYLLRPQWSASGWKCHDGVTPTFRELDWPEVWNERRDDGLVLVLADPEWDDYHDDRSDPEDGVYVYETDSSEESCGSSFSEESDGGREDDDIMELSLESQEFL